MTCANQQIVDSFERLEMTPEQIAESYELDVITVKAVLAQFSDKYRRAANGNEDLDFKDDELARANQIIANLAFYADDPNLQFRAARYIRQDRKGRLDGIKGLRGLNFNATVFNIHLQQANQAVAKGRETKEIEIPEAEVKMLQGA